MKKILALIFVFSITAHAAPPAPRRSVWAAISVGKPVFILGREEIDFSFAAVNDTPEPILYEDLRGGGVLIINGEELKDSGIIFGNGPREAAKYLQPGKSTQFLYRLTRYFTKKGIYEVVWKGNIFRTKPMVFRVIENN